MKKIILSLLALIGACHYASAIRFTVSAPNYFRLDVPETVSVTISEHPNPVEVEIYLKENTPKQKILHLQRVQVQDGKPKIVQLKYSASDIPDTQNKKDPLSVYLGIKASKNEFAGKEVLVPVRKYAGYAFVQTDKPLYSPKENVQIRVLHLNEDLLPSDRPFQLVIKNPKGQNVYHKEFKPEQKGITEHTFKFSSIPILGNWSVTALYGHDFTGESAVHFELKEYVLPTFSVSIQPPKYILNTHQRIDTKISATYVYGKPVEGLLNIKYAIKAPNGHLYSIGSAQLIKLVKGERYLTIDVQKDIKDKRVPWFPAVSGSHFLIEAEVIEKATGNREIAVDESTVLSFSPYTLSFPRSMKDFKPGVPYQVQVDVKLANGVRAPKVPVKVVKAASKKNGVDARILQSPLPMMTDELGTVMFEFDTVETDVQLEMTISTDDPNLDRANQATNVLTVNNFKSPAAAGNSYVWIAAPQDVIFKVGKSFQTKVTVYPAQGNIKLHYMVVSRGKILTVNETATQQGAVVRTIQFIVTPEMSPSARLLVYIVKNNQIIADSLRFEVEKRCKYNDGKELKIKTASNEVRPGSSIEIKLEGEPDSTVGLLAVDSAVYLLNKEDLLTRQAMFVELSKRDFGCGPGGGINTEAVLQNAGLIVLSNAAVNPHGKQGDCNVKNRRRRSTEAEEELPDTPVFNYTGQALVCCKLGKLDGPPGMDCIARAAKIHEAVGDKENCSQAFLDCCESQVTYMSSYTQIARSAFDKKRRNELELSESELLDKFESDTLKNVRFNFPETWIFNSYKIGSRECKGRKNDFCELDFSVPHSITTWLIQAVGISRTTGMCVAESVNLKVLKNIFIQMELPYSAVRGEQIEVPVTVFNYDSKEIIVTLYMYGVEGVCMGAAAGEKSEAQKITVRSNSASSVRFPVMPLEVANFPIRVIALSIDGSDAVEKMLNVIPEGIPEIKTLTITLDPRGVIRNRNKRDLAENGVREHFDINRSMQSLVIDLTLPRDRVPGTGKCLVSVMGDLLGQAVTTSILGLEKRFLRLPQGCGEQTMITLAPLVYTMLYLKRSDKLTAETEKTGYALMQQGYAHQLTYRKAEGGFAVWTHKEAGAWLTAFVAKVFCQANMFINVPEHVRCGAVSWLLQRQKANGVFYETDGILALHREMTGGIQGDISLTSFVLIGLLECDKCDSANKRIATSRAITYLEQNVEFLNKPYVLSLVTYALALAKSQFAAKANEKLKKLAIYDEAKDTRYWNWAADEFQGATKPWIFTTRPTALAVETTSYALLAQLLFDDILYSHPIANWLNQQRNAEGAFVSTQDTVMALQALAEYSFRSKIPPLDMHVNLTSQARSRAKKSIRITNENSLMLHEVEMPAEGMLHVDASGRGVATMTVSLHYNVESKDKSKCKFDLRVKTIESDNIVLPGMVNKGFDDIFLQPNIVRSITSKNDQKYYLNYKVDGLDDDDDDDDAVDRNRAGEKDDQKHHVVKLEICVRHLDNEPAGMSILEVGLFTGYKPFKDDIDALVQDPDIPISQYEPSDRSLVFYFEQIPHDEDLCIQLRTFQNVIVGKVQPTTVKVYDYYEPDHTCTKFYRPDGDSPMLSPICEGHQCRCVEGQCPTCRPFEGIKNIPSDKVRRDELLAMACNKHHFVWNGTLKRINKGDSFDEFVYHVSEVLKEGLQSAEAVVGKEISFTGRSACACPEMKRGRNYIIMGSDGFRYQKEDGSYGYKYVFDKKSSVYETMHLREIEDRQDQNLQKTFNWLYTRMAVRGIPCDN